MKLLGFELHLENNAEISTRPSIKGGGMIDLCFSNFDREAVTEQTV